MSGAGLFVGLATVDVIYEVSEVPARNEKAAAQSQVISTGGPAATAAATHAFLGGRTRLATAIGRHALGQLIRADLAQHEIELIDLAGDRADAPPISAIAVVPGGDRTVISANAQVFGELEFVPDDCILRDVSGVLVDGHYMRACMAMAQAARRRSIPVILDAGSWKKGLDVLLGSVTTAICSDDFRPPGCADAEDVFRFLRQSGVQQAAIARGAAPVLYAEGEHRGEIAVPRANAVDTTGAGDVFHGAFCYASATREWAESLSFAAQVASFSCGYPGKAWMEHWQSSRRA